MAKVIIIDDKAYAVRITELKRTADILDKYAERDEKGELHREVIGTYYNYQLKIGVKMGERDLYNELFDVLSAPVDCHDVELPHDHIKFKGYFSSISDNIKMIDDDGFDANGLSCKLTCMKPRRTP